MRGLWPASPTRSSPYLKRLGRLRNEKPNLLLNEVRISSPHYDEEGIHVHPFSGAWGRVKHETGGAEDGLDNLFRPDVRREVGHCNEDLALEWLE
jgi:hypothetical protein